MPDGPLDDYLARGRRILFDGEEDDGFLPFICCLDNKEQVHDPENWPMGKSVPPVPSGFASGDPGGIQRVD